MPEERKLLVTHHAPDLDAVTSVWMLKRFNTEHFGTAKVAFVNPGESLSQSMAEHLGFSLNQVTHTDTGLGEFDHHQPERGQQFICATSLVFDHICTIQPDKKTDKALKALVAYVTDVDHFQEIYWPDASHDRYTFMLHELLKGLESIDPHDDDSILNFGMQALDAAYSQLTLEKRAEELIIERGQIFNLSIGKCMAIETSNDDVIKVAQKQGYAVVIRKDANAGHVRIKARPDAKIDLKAASDEISRRDEDGTWYYHPGGKMLLNGSAKHRDQKPTHLTIPELIHVMQEAYGSRP